MATTCEIEFENNPRKIVYAGQFLKGTVRLNIVKSITVRSIYVRINGKIFAEWDDGISTMLVRKKLFDKKMNIVSPLPTEKETQLKPGRYSYTFEITLPCDVPSSFQGKYGYIKHNIRVVLDVPFRVNKQFKEQFTLIKALNLNDIPSLRKPLIVKKSKEMYPICCIFFGVGLFKMSAQIPVSGFLPYQTVNLEINVSNQSALAISQFKIQLIQSINYSKWYNYCGLIGRDKKPEEKYLLQKINDGCDKYEDKIMYVDVDIPPTLPTEITMIDNIQIEYKIRITAITPSFYRNIVLDVPITIGSYPFYNNA